MIGTNELKLKNAKHEHNVNHLQTPKSITTQRCAVNLVCLIDLDAHGGYRA